MEEQDHIKFLLERYKAGTITDVEKAVLDKWYLHVAADSSNELSDEERLQTFDTVLASLNEVVDRKRTARLWPSVAAAAAILLVCSAGYFFLRQHKQVVQLAQVQQQDLLPGINKAVLKTGGKAIVLNNIQNTQIGNVNISKNQLTYVKSTEAVAIYDTLINPRGSTPYHLQLIDGTKILVNAATTIRYPKTFNDKDRKVELIGGEAYFEVVHNEAQPFSVTTRQMTIEDIGTHFNVSAYADEKAVTATLVEGSIKVNNRVIEPGEQAISGEHLTVKKADLEETLAWTNGLFHFDHADLQNVMRQIACVYDVQVVYEGSIPKMTIHGEMYRSLKASQVFEGLDYLKVKFRIEGKKIIVSNK